MWASIAGEHSRPALLTIAVVDTALTVENITIIPGPAGTAHHIDFGGPTSPTLFAADVEGRAFVFDATDKHHPKLLRQLGAVPGLAEPHGFARAPSGDTFVAYQSGPLSAPGGVAQFTSIGTFLQAVRLDSESVGGVPFKPYSIVVLKTKNQMLITGADMMNGDSTKSIQLWTLAPLAPISTIVLPSGARGNENGAPSVAYASRDELTVFLSTYRCGLYRLENLAKGVPSASLLHTFSSDLCGMGAMMGDLWLQTLTKPGRIVVSRISPVSDFREIDTVALGDEAQPHWIYADSATRTAVVSGFGSLSRKILLLRPAPNSLKTKKTNEVERNSWSVFKANFDSVRSDLGTFRLRELHGAIFVP